MAVGAAMYSTLRTDVLPPAIVLRPHIRPESRLIGATPTRAASWCRPMVPNSGTSARRVRAVTSPMPGTDFRSASASRQTGEVLIAWPMSWSTAASSFCRKRTWRSSLFARCLSTTWPRRLVSMPIISMIWRRLPTSSARWLLSGSGRGRACGLTRSAKRAITSASSVSVLARRPMALAKSRIPGEVTDLARVDDTQRQPGAGEGRRDGCFKAARRLQDDKGDGQIAEAAGEAVQPLCVSRDAEGLTRRSEMDVEAIFGHVDADEDGGKFVHDPTLRMRAQAQAAVRVRDCESGGRTKLCPGLASPRRTRADPHLQPRRLRSGGQLRHTRRSVERYTA